MAGKLLKLNNSMIDYFLFLLIIFFDYLENYTPAEWL